MNLEKRKKLEKNERGLALSVFEFEEIYHSLSLIKGVDKKMSIFSFLKKESSSSPPTTIITKISPSHTKHLIIPSLHPHKHPPPRTYTATQLSFSHQNVNPQLPLSSSKPSFHCSSTHAFSNYHISKTLSKSTSLPANPCFLSRSNFIEKQTHNLLHINHPQTSSNVYLQLQPPSIHPLQTCRETF